MADDDLPDGSRTGNKGLSRNGVRGLLITTAVVVIPGSLAAGALYLGIRAYRRRAAKGTAEE